MRIDALRRLSALGVILALAFAGLFAGTTQANAQPMSDGTAATTTLFDINGTYTDGGSARPVISNVDDILTVNMSSQGRPTATGVVLNSDTIIVTFPDDATYTAKLQLPETIRWSNGSAWTKLSIRAVPNLRGLTLTEARLRLQAAGFVLGLVSSFIDPTCNFIGLVGRQTPTAGTLAVVGSRVNVSIGREPPFTPCP